MLKKGDQKIAEHFAKARVIRVKHTAPETPPADAASPSVPAAVSPPAATPIVHATTNHGMSPLMVAARMGNADIVKLLLENSADVSSKVNLTAIEAEKKAAEEERVRLVSDPHLRRNLPVPKHPLGDNK